LEPRAIGALWLRVGIRAAASGSSVIVGDSVVPQMHYDIKCHIECDNAPTASDKFVS